MSTTTAPSAAPTRAQIDPRGPRFNAWVTAALLLAVLVLAPHPVAIALIALQAGLFGWAVLAGVHETPHAWAFKAFIRPRLKAPEYLEAPEPPRFAQGVGLAFALVATVAYAADAVTIGGIATGFALVAASLNAVFGICLGCKMYGWRQRFNVLTTTP